MLVARLEEKGANLCGPQTYQKKKPPVKGALSHSRLEKSLLRILPQLAGERNWRRGTSVDSNRAGQTNGFQASLCDALERLEESLHVVEAVQAGVTQIDSKVERSTINKDPRPRRKQVGDGSGNPGV